MSEFVTLKDVKKIYQMGEVEIMAAAGIDFELHIDWSFVNSCFAGRSIVFFS